MDPPGSAAARFEQLSAQARRLGSQRGQRRVHTPCRRCPPPSARCRRSLLRPASLPPRPCPPPPTQQRQWEKYERKVAERSAEQQSALSKSAGLLDSMRKRFGTPAATPAADPLATPRAGLVAAVAGGLPPTQLPPSAAVGATPRPASGAALKENLAAELNRSLGATPAPPNGASSFAAAAAAAAAAAGGGGAGDSALQQASNLFLQQVEGMRRKYTAEVDRLKVRRGCCPRVALPAALSVSHHKNEQ